MSDAISSYIDGGTAYFLAPALATLGVLFILTPTVQGFLENYIPSPGSRFFVTAVLIFLVIFIGIRIANLSQDPRQLVITANPTIFDFCLPPAKPIPLST
jgi:hypothetical protein